MAADIIARGLALGAQESADLANSRIDALPKGLVYKGAVNYYADLPTNAKVGDTYTVKYKGTEGTDPDGSEYAWGTYEGTKQWIPLGPELNIVQTTGTSASAVMSQNAVTTALNAKQDTLVDSGENQNIKTINNTSVLGSGNINIDTGLMSVSHNDTLTGAGTAASPLEVDSTKYATAAQGAKADTALQSVPDTYRTSADQDIIDATKQATLVSGTNIKTINNNSLLGSGNMSIKTYQPFPNGELSGTLSEVVTAIMAFPDKAQGMAYLGSIRGACTPFGYGNAECTVAFMTSTIAVLTVSSSNVTPYHWEYNTAQNDYIWRKWSDVLANPTGTTSNTLTKVAIDGISYNIPVTTYSGSSGILVDQNTHEITPDPTVLATVSSVNTKLDATKSTYQTTAPTGDITDGGVHLVYLATEPETYYDGYIYLIKE